jgi:hypothetical protein
VFPSEATFYGAEFSGGVDFRNSAFLSEVVFLSAEFSGDADLSETVFSAYAHFGEATFISRAKFRKATFLSDASFLRTRFSREAFFDEAKFFGPALFIETTFSKNADFERTAFSNSASFNEATFSGKVDFKEAAFSNDAYFYKTAFSGDAHFDKAAFSSGGYFKEAAFSEDAHFYKTRFSGDANFDKAVFSGKVDFKEAVFSREADFQACEFRSSTSFAFTEFLSQVPDFRDAKLREATKWYLVQWPHAPTGWLEAQKHVSAYERLKAEMERLKKHEDEQFFFAKELRARRALLWFNARSGSGGFGARATAAFEWLLNATYAAFSGYGQSVGKPICWLIAAFGLGAYALATSSFISPCPVDPGQAALLSAINLLPFLPYKAEKIVDKDIIDCLEPSAGVIGDLQSLLGVLLLFLLGLALRNRFRMK